MSILRVTCVTGFPRCGATLLMRMLAGSGMKWLGDNEVSFEDRRVAGLPDEWEWLREAQGKVVKILDPDVFAPPRALSYDFLWVARHPVEQSKSMEKFRDAVGPMSHRMVGWSQKQMARALIRDTPPTMNMLDAYRDSRVIQVKFEDLLERPGETILMLSDVLGRYLSPKAAANVVKRRGSKCEPGLEIELERMQEVETLERRRAERPAGRPS